MSKTKQQVKILSVDRLKDVLYYSEDTGIFVWKKKTNIKGKMCVGDVAGCVHQDGHRSIGIDKRRHKAHRLAWFYVHGVWPEIIDHINGNRDDNRIMNLRSVDGFGNMQNQRKPHSRGCSGYLGVSKGYRGFWNAAIQTNKKRVFLGSFNTPEDASDAYISAKRERHVTCSI